MLHIIPNRCFMSKDKKLAPVIAICNHKGGCGKTTSVVNLASEFGRNGCGVLVVDLDPQGNASNHIGAVRYEKLLSNITLLFCDPSSRTDISKILEAVHSNVNPGFENVWYIPSAQSLDKIVAETIKITSPRPSEELKVRLDKIREAFDVILVDCPPSLTTLTENAISAATHYITPIDTGTDYSISGWISLIEHIGKISEITNPDLEYLGALLTRHDQTKNVNKAIAFSVSELEKDLSTSGRLLPVYIHNSIKVGESSIVSAPIRKIAKSNKVTKDYEILATYLIKELKLSRSYAISGNKKEKLGV